jgi:hypothetical protein
VGAELQLVRGHVDEIDREVLRSVHCRVVSVTAGALPLARSGGRSDARLVAKTTHPTSLNPLDSGERVGQDWRTAADRPAAPPGYRRDMGDE